VDVLQRNVPAPVPERCLRHHLHPGKPIFLSSDGNQNYYTNSLI
jgi:hypothetical protein